MQKNRAKILSLVPSWTETFLAAGMDVVGRTRFCIHPEALVKNIPAVGGTKHISTDEILNLKIDAAILDREENKKEMADFLTDCGIEIIDSHVLSLNDAGDFLEKCAARFANPALQKYSRDYFRLSEQKFSKEKFENLAIIRRNAPLPDGPVRYVIWRRPFMAVSNGTYIADVLARFDIQLVSSETEKYPVVSDEDIKKTYSLFSTEPYPFTKDFEQLSSQGYRGALIDGEKISWYGVRSLKFLQECAQ